MGDILKLVRLVLCCEGLLSQLVTEGNRRLSIAML